MRVLLVSTGSEESLLEGMRGFVARHAAALPRERTRFVIVECVGAPEAILLEGEGMLRGHDYRPRRATGSPRAASAPAGRCGGGCARASRPTRWSRSRPATRRPCSASIDEYKMAPNYHSQRDVASNLSFETVAGVTEICLEAVRSLSRRAAPAPA